jgi:hypothetical protein
MTLYRDDIQETIAYSNTTLSKTKGISEEIIRLREESLHRLSVYSADSIVLSDLILDSTIFPSRESVSVLDNVSGRLVGRDYIYDEINVTEQYKNKLRTKSFVFDQLNAGNDQNDSLRGKSIELLLITDVFKTKKYSIVSLNEKISLKESLYSKAIYKDFIQDNITIAELVSKQITISNVHDHIIFNEEYKTKKITRSVINEKIKVSDRMLSRFIDRVTDQIHYDELSSQRLNAKQSVIESISSAESIKQQRKVKQWVHENLTLVELFRGKNRAKQNISDLIFVEEDESVYKKYGYAWTSNVDTWAMSRYQDYGYSEIAVVDGVLYGVAENGLYRLDAETFIEGKLVTGLLDLGQGSLVHPLGAYLEYELAGDTKSLTVGVSSTQSGTKQTYYYNLPKEPSNYLTNGRVQFGRGLRGRHFSFEIKIGGLYGYINDFSIDIAGTKRRV